MPPLNIAHLHIYFTIYCSGCVFIRKKNPKVRSKEIQNRVCYTEANERAYSPLQQLPRTYRQALIYGTLGVEYALTLATYMITVLLTFPLLIFLILSVLFKRWPRTEKHAIRLAADITTPLFLGAVSFLWFEVWSAGSYWVFVTILLLVGAMFTYYYAKVYEELQPKKLVKGLWRLLFILVMPIYLVVFTYGFVSSMFTYFSS